MPHSWGIALFAAVSPFDLHHPCAAMSPPQVPGPIRYVWWLIWSVVREAGYQLRKKAVIAGKQGSGVKGGLGELTMYLKPHDLAAAGARHFRAQQVGHVLSIEAR